VTGDAVVLTGEDLASISASRDVKAAALAAIDSRASTFTEFLRDNTGVFTSESLREVAEVLGGFRDEDVTDSEALESFHDTLGRESLSGCGSCGDEASDDLFEVLEFFLSDDFGVLTFVLLFVTASEKDRSSAISNLRSNKASSAAFAPPRVRNTAVRTDTASVKARNCVAAFCRFPAAISTVTASTLCTIDTWVISCPRFATAATVAGATVAGTASAGPACVVGESGGRVGGERETERT